MNESPSSPALVSSLPSAFPHDGAVSPILGKASERGDAHHPICIFLESSVSVDGAGLEEAAEFWVSADAVLNTRVTTGLPEGLAGMLGALVLPLGAELGVKLGGGQGDWIEMIFSW